MKGITVAPWFRTATTDTAAPPVPLRLAEEAATTPRRRVGLATLAASLPCWELCCRHAPRQEACCLM